jgi:hypothetical protein
MIIRETNRNEESKEANDFDSKDNKILRFMRKIWHEKKREL